MQLNTFMVLLLRLLLKQLGVLYIKYHDADETSYSSKLKAEILIYQFIH